MSRRTVDKPPTERARPGKRSKPEVAAEAVRLCPTRRTELFSSAVDHG